MQSGDYNLCKYFGKTNYFQEKSEKKRNFLLKNFADTENCRIFAVHLRNTDAYLTHRNPYNNASLFDLLTFSAIKSILYICALDSYHIRITCNTTY